MKRSAILVTIFALTALGAGVASANHCDNDSLGRPVTLNSGFSATDQDTVPAPSIYPFPTCSAAWAVPAELPETRRIVPGANQVSVAYFGSTDPATLTATLNGMGFTARSVTIRKTAIAGGGNVWSSSWVALPGGPALSGSITVTVTSPNGTRSETFVVV